MESTLQGPAVVAAKANPRAGTVYWIFTALFCLQMSFTAYASLRLPQVAEAFAHLGFPAYFRLELSWAKLIGAAVLLAPVPRRFQEWAYAGFAIDLGSALIAHLAVGDGPEAWGWAAATGALWGLSYIFWRRLPARQGSARPRESPDGDPATGAATQYLRTTGPQRVRDEERTPCAS